MSQLTTSCSSTGSIAELRGSDHDPHLQALQALLPVSFALAKDWLLREQKAQSEAIQIRAVTEEACEVVAHLNCSLAEQPATTAALLDQPACPASPVVPQPVMSLGPEPVTDEERAEERVEKRAHCARDLTTPLYGCMIAFQRSELPADYHNKKEAVSPQTIFCEGGAGTKWRSGQ